MRPRSLAALITLCAVVPLLATAAEPGTVTLSVDDYLELRANVDVNRRAADEHGVDWTSSEPARFRLELGAEQATFVETVRVTPPTRHDVGAAIASGPVERITLRPSTSAYVYRDDRGWTMLASSSRTPVEVEVGLTLEPTLDDDGVRRVRFRAPAFPVQRGTITVDAIDVEITLVGGVVLERRSSGEKTTVDAALEPSADVVVSWRGRTLDERLGDEPLLTTSILHAVHQIAGDRLITDIDVTMTPTAGLLAEIAFEVPPASQVMYLRGSGLLAWELDGDHVRAQRLEGSREPLVAELRVVSTVTDERRLALELPRLVGDGPVELFVELRSPPEALVEAIDHGDLALVDRHRLPAAIVPHAESDEVFHGRIDAGREIALPAFRVHRPAAAEVLSAQVLELRGHTLVAANGRSMTHVELSVVAAGKELLAIELPAGSTLWGARREGVAVRLPQPERGTIALPLAGRDQGSVSYDLTWVGAVSMPDDKGVIQLAMPRLDVPVAEVEWSVVVAREAELELIGSDYEIGQGPHRTRTSGSASSSERSELFASAVEALSRDALGRGRPPIVPGDLRLSSPLTVHARLPPTPFASLRFELEPKKNKDKWR